jgi:vanillate O-demethylase monooxygenase subunit
MIPMPLNEDSPFQVMRRAWQPVALSSSLPPDEVLGFCLLDHDVVIARLEGGLLAAEDSCPHKGFTLSKGHACGNELMCAYHGWKFDADGKCVGIPSLPTASIAKLAASGLKKYGVQEKYGMIWVQLENDPEERIPQIPEFENDSWGYLLGPPTPFAAGWRREVENFLDMTHFAFAHANTLGQAATHTLPEMEIKTRAKALTSTGSSTSNDAASNDVTLPSDVSSPSGEPDFTMTTQFPATSSPGSEPAKLASAHARLYRTWLPNFSVIRQSWRDGDERLLLHIPVPNTHESCTVFWALAISPNFDGPPAQSQMDFAVRVLDEDRVMCEGQRPREVPLNPSRGGWGVLVAPGDTLANTFQRELRGWITQRLQATEA